MQGEVLNKLRFGSDTVEYDGVGVMSVLGLIFGIYPAVEQVGTGTLHAQQVHQDHETGEVALPHDALVRELREGDNFLGRG